LLPATGEPAPAIVSRPWFFASLFPATASSETSATARKWATGFEFMGMSACPTKFELRTRVSEEPDQKLMIQDLEKWLKGKGTAFSFQLVPVFGFGKLDFHDRRLVFQPEQSNTKKRITVLMTGGIDRYLDSKFECSIVIQT
jgi:hypothetical protein